MVKITSCLVFVIDHDYHTEHTLPWIYIFVFQLKDDKARKEVFVIGEFCAYKSLLATGLVMTK